MDGRLTDISQPLIHADDHGVIVGDGAFETLLVIDVPAPTTLTTQKKKLATELTTSSPNTTNTHSNPNTLAINKLQQAKMKQAFAVQRHLNRLRHSLRVLDIQCPYSDEEIRAAIDTCIAATTDAGVIRITVTSGRGSLNSRRGHGEVKVIVMAGDQPPKYLPGTNVAVMSFPRNERSVTAGVKSTSYVENVLALRLASQKQASEAIFHDTQGRLSEGTGSNIFWVEGDTLHTSPLDTGCLAGVTRELIMEQLDVTPKHLPIDELAEVDEAFLTSTTRKVQSIGSVDGIKLPVVGGELTLKAAAVLDYLIMTDIDP